MAVRGEFLPACFKTRWYICSDMAKASSPLPIFCMAMTQSKSLRLKVLASSGSFCTLAIMLVKDWCASWYWPWATKAVA